MKEQQPNSEYEPRKLKIVFDIDSTITGNIEWYRQFSFMLHRWTAEGGVVAHEVHLLTSRDAKWRELTEEQLQWMGIPYDKLEMVGGMTDHAIAGVLKAEYCRDNNIDIWFDDAHPQYGDTVKICPDTALIWV